LAGRDYELKAVISNYNLPFLRWFAVLAPRAVLVTDFTVPEPPQSEGDGKNLAPLPHHLPLLRRQRCWQSVAFLTPSSFGSRCGRANNKTSSSESVIATDDLNILGYEQSMAQASDFMRACAK
jgi:hypothetical protein